MILTPVWTSLEVVMGVLIPYVTASIIDKGINAGNLPEVYKYGLIMVAMACLSLLFGILAGRYAGYFQGPIVVTGTATINNIGLIN